MGSRELRDYIEPIVMFGMLFFLVEFFFLKYMPYTHWYEYVEVRPVEQVFELWEEPYFQSFADFHRTTKVEWFDTLRCDFDDDIDLYQFYYTYHSAALAKKSVAQVDPSPRRYAHPWPSIPATCYLDTLIIGNLDYGIQKKQRIIGETFRFE